MQVTVGNAHHETSLGIFKRTFADIPFLLTPPGIRHSPGLLAPLRMQQKPGTEGEKDSGIRQLLGVRVSLRCHDRKSECMKRQSI